MKLSFPKARKLRFSTRNIFIATPIAFSTLWGCGLVLDDFTKITPPPAPPETCPPQSYPPQPSTESEPGDKQFVVAVKTVDLGEAAPADNPVGLNLDQVCTACATADGGTSDGGAEDPAAISSCIFPSWATKKQCDDINGIDNAVAKLFKTLGEFVSVDGITSSYYNDEADKGAWSILIRVSGYNGTPNDKNIVVELLTTPGLYKAASGAGGGGGAGGSSPEIKANWDGTDEWPVPVDILKNSNGVSPGLDEPNGGGPGYQSVYIDKNAYVADGILVATIPTADIDLAGSGAGQFLIRLYAGSLVGQIVDPDGTGTKFELKDTVISGRWKTSDFFNRLGSVKVSNYTFCRDDLITYGTFKKNLCSYVDIASTLGGPTISCDSVSFAMRMQGFPAKVGRTSNARPVVDLCVEQGKLSPAGDDCK